MAQFLVGTSGWSYASWRGVFYPARLVHSKWLPYFAENFDTAEVNYSFYHLPRQTTYENWYRLTPPGFVFAVKCSRFITHIRRLDGIAESWNNFLERALTLKEKLGPILLQFPPSFRATAEHLARIEAFLCLARSSAPLRIAMEFRHASCFDASMIELLSHYRAALVIPHSTRYPAPVITATAPFAYFRFHGPEAMWSSCYPDEQLREWSHPIKAFLDNGTDVYAYFNNDFGGNAVLNARTLRTMVCAERSRAGGRV